MTPILLRLAGVFSLLVLSGTAVVGAPFAERIPFTQPDGRQIVLWGQGDEFTPCSRPWTATRSSSTTRLGAYEYADLSTDGDQLVSTGVAVGQGDPLALRLRPHLRINPEAR